MSSISGPQHCLGLLPPPPHGFRDSRRQDIADLAVDANGQHADSVKPSLRLVGPGLGGGPGDRTFMGREINAKNPGGVDAAPRQARDGKQARALLGSTGDDGQLGQVLLQAKSIFGRGPVVDDRVGHRGIRNDVGTVVHAEAGRGHCPLLLL